MHKKELSDEDYERLKNFLGNYVDWFWAGKEIPPEVHPLNVLAGFEKRSRAIALDGLKQTINDIVEETTDWTPDRIAAADAKFAAANTFTLSEVRRRYSRKYLKLLERGVIRSETEYYLLKGIRDGGGIEPGAAEGGQIDAMLSAFEAESIRSTK